jgi:hypothetical protein
MDLANYLMGTPILPRIGTCRIEDVIIIFDFHVDNCIAIGALGGHT